MKLNISLVRNPPLFVNLSSFPPDIHVPSNAKVYRYIGADAALIDLKEANYGDTALWQETTIDAQTFAPNFDDNKFDSSFQNAKTTTSPREPVDGDEDVYRIIKTVQKGYKDLYTHTLKADYPIGIHFGSSPANPSIHISSHGGIRLLSSIYSPANGSINLFSTGGSVLANEGAVVFGVSPAVIADMDVDLLIEGDKGRLDVLAGGDIDLVAISADNLSSRFVIGTVISTGGDVRIQALDGISNASSTTSKIEGDRIELNISEGQIGFPASPLRIESNTLGTGGLAALGDGNIFITQTNGDMPLIRATSFTATASVESLTGDVRLTNLDGSILDGDLETYKKRNATPNSSLQNRFIADGVASGLFSAQATSFPLSPSLMKFIAPHANVIAVPLTNTERLNVKAQNVVLTTSGIDGSVGSIANNVLISNPRNFGALTTQQAALLSSSRPEDILGVHYGLYRYMGTNQLNVDLTLEDFSNTARWQKLNPHFSTGANGDVAVNITVATSQRVRVDFSAELYGMYEYLGSTGLLNLTSENYSDGARWRLLTGAFATDGGPASLTNGILITSKFTIDALTIRKSEDLNVNATVSLHVTAHDHVNIESPNNMFISRIEAGGDLILRRRQARRQLHRCRCDRRRWQRTAHRRGRRERFQWDTPLQHSNRSDWVASLRCQWCDVNPTTQRRHDDQRLSSTDQPSFCGSW